MEFKIDKRFKKKLQARYERFDIQAGVLKDGPHRAPKSKNKGLGVLQGGPVRKKKSTVSGTVARVSERVRKEQVNYLTAPFEKTKSKPMLEFRKALGDLLTRKTRHYDKVQAALRLVVRTPILRQAYGSNSRRTARIKGFNRRLIDTGQFFRAILAKIKVRK